jgi:HCOMODA/2-hydroxy-3-carboxy-muconic semialdehyde decarboxylase
MKQAFTQSSLLSKTLFSFFLCFLTHVGLYAQTKAVDPNIVDELVAANKILASEGILDGWGHVSVRNPKDPTHYFLARNLAAELVTAKDILEFTLDNVPIDGKGQDLYTERFIHGEIYKARPDVNAVVHTHAPPLIPFTVTQVPMRPLYHRAAFVAQGIPVFDIQDDFGMTDMLIRNAQHGHSLAKTLADKPAALMRGHGATVVGPSLPRLVGRTVFLVKNATLQQQALALGGPIKYLNPEEAKLIEAREGYGLGRQWLAWKQKVGITTREP